ncbi:Cobalt-zinc-cadmium resistance protein CzcC [subsurface metagenome]
MRKITCSFLIVGVFFSTFPLFSQEVPRGKTALSELIEEALSQNPQIKAARNEWEASLQVIPQAKSLPDPMLSYSYFGQSVETRLGPQRNKFSLSQKFPFFGKLSLKGEIARKGASVLEEQYMAVKLNIVLKVKNTFFSLFWLDRAIRIAQEEKEVLERLTKIAEKKYETGEANQQDVLKAQLEISKVQDKILILNQRRRAIAAELNALLNRRPDSFIGEVEEFEVPELRFELEKLYEWAREMRPELRKAQHFIAKNKESLKLAKKNYFPDFRLMFDYIDIGGGTTTNIKDGRNSWMASVGINIPIWRKRLHAAEAEAATKLKASQDSYKNVQNETLSRVNELFFEVETVSEQVNLYKYSLLPQAEQSLKASEVGYLTGKVDFLDLLDAERMVLLIRIGYFKTIADLGKSLAQLERVVGKDLSSKYED